MDYYDNNQNQMNNGYDPNAGYTDPNSGYTDPNAGYGGYPAQNGYPSAPGYPDANGGYPGQPGGYPSAPGYPDANGGYPGQPGGYPGGYPGYPGGYPGQMPPAQQGSSGLAIASMVLGILAVITSCWAFGIVFALIGLILGGVSLGNHAGGKGMAIAGLVLSIIALTWGLIVILAFAGSFWAFF